MSIKQVARAFSCYYLQVVQILIAKLPSCRSALTFLGVWNSMVFVVFSLDQEPFVS